MDKIIGYTNQFGKVCQIVQHGEQINIEETKTKSID
jgi:hypothetical protein